MSRKTLLHISLTGLVALTPMLLPQAGFAQPSTNVEAQQQPNKSIRTIRNLFNNYYDGLEENTESAENKAAMKSALQSLPASLKDIDLLLLINVWMYYDPTDFPTRELITPIFFKNKERSLVAVTRRLKHKKKQESPDRAPYLDLVALQKQLSK